MTTSSQSKPFPFAKAKAFILSFGPYAEKSLDQIAETDDGLRYLDNLNGKISGGYLGLCLDTYLNDPVIAKELHDIIAKRANARYYSL